MYFHVAFRSEIAGFFIVALKRITAIGGVTTYDSSVSVSQYSERSTEAHFIRINNQFRNIVVVNVSKSKFDINLLF